MTIPTQPQSGMNPAAKGCLGIFVGLMLMAGCTAIAIESDDDTESSYSSSDSYDSGADDSSNTEPEPLEVETETIEPETPDTDITDAAMELTWEQAPEEQRDTLCQGIDMFGTDWAARQLQSGGDTVSGDDVIDWDRAAQILETKCDQR